MNQIRNIVTISDTHFGCQLAVCPRKFKLDGAGYYYPSRLQKQLLKMWEYFWKEFVPHVTDNEKFILVHNGDIIDGIHHNSVTQISQNLKDQRNMAIEMLMPVIDSPNCAGYFQIRGTEAHAGKSQQEEETIADTLGAIADEDGLKSRYDLWLRFSLDKILCHFSHHIGTTNSASYESTAPHKELIEAYVEAGRWKLEPPDIIIRSHRHRFYENTMPAKNIFAKSVITPAWQLKTPFVWKQGMGRTSTPQIGGVVLRNGNEVPIYVRAKFWNVERSHEVVV